MNRYSIWNFVLNIFRSAPLIKNLEKIVRKQIYIIYICKIKSHLAQNFETGFLRNYDTLIKFIIQFVYLMHVFIRYKIPCNTKVCTPWRIAKFQFQWYHQLVTMKRVGLSTISRDNIKRGYEKDEWIIKNRKLKKLKDLSGVHFFIPYVMFLWCFCNSKLFISYKIWEWYAEEKVIKHTYLEQY